MKARLVCEKCGFNVSFDDNDPKGYYNALDLMEKHCDEKHPKSPRFHNYTHIEWFNEYTQKWYR